jgi:hypothetical protein
MHKYGEENEKLITNYKECIEEYNYKETVLSEALKLASGTTEFRETQVEYH